VVGRRGLRQIGGNEFGPRAIEIGNWSGKAVFSPVSTVAKVIDRQELARPGIYFLKSSLDAEGFSERIYIGEGERVIDRLRYHLRDDDREFSEFIGFFSKDEMLTKSHIKYLESRLISLALEAKTAEVENSNSPGLPALPEADTSDMEYFLSQIKLILPIMGFTCLVPTVVRRTSDEQTEIPSQKSSATYSLRSQRFGAKMYESDQGFIVVAGSECSKETADSISEGWTRLRKKLLDSGALLDKGDRLEFKEDTIFKSVSAASSVILGRQSAGPIEWIRQDGHTYKETQQELFAGNSGSSAA
jgi:hypothetical protein